MYLHLFLLLHLYQDPNLVEVRGNTEKLLSRNKYQEVQYIHRFSFWIFMQLRIRMILNEKFIKICFLGLKVTY